jgi:methylisocitrate lyase
MALRSGLQGRERRLDPDFFINARTDAIAVEGSKARRQGEAYAEAGADLIFLEATRSEEQIREAVAGSRPL